MKNPLVFLDISIGGQPAGKIQIELYADVAPIAAENFRALCTGEKGKGTITGKPLHYKGTVFSRIYRNAYAEGGDIAHSKYPCDVGESIYNGYFPNENYEIPLSKAGWLSMKSFGPDKLNGSKFVISLGDLRYLNGHRCVFGKVIGGMETVEKIKLMGARNGRPIAPVVITDCGQMPKDTNCGEIPEDEKNYVTESLKRKKKENAERDKSSNSVLKFYYSKRKCWTYKSDPYKVYFPTLEKSLEYIKNNVNVVGQDCCRPKSASKFYSSTRKYWQSISELECYSCQCSDSEDDVKESCKGKKRVVSFDGQEEKKQRVNDKRRKHSRSKSTTSFSEDVKYLSYEPPDSVSVLYSSD